MEVVRFVTRGTVEEKILTMHGGEAEVEAERGPEQAEQAGSSTDPLPPRAPQAAQASLTVEQLQMLFAG